MTLTGDLWFAATNVSGMEIRRAPLLLLAGIFDVAFVLVLVRVRYVMGEYLKTIRGFHAQGFTEAQGDRWFNKSKTVMRAFSSALLLTAGVSLVGFVYFELEATGRVCFR